MSQEISYQQLLDFVKASPDQKVNMQINSVHKKVFPDDCGCIMFQYAQAQGLKTPHCGLDEIYDGANEIFLGLKPGKIAPAFTLDNSAKHFISRCLGYVRSIKTFRDALRFA